MPFPLLLVCMKQPMFVVLSLQGSQGMSDPFTLDSTAGCIYWNKDTSILYIGHESGAVSAYKIQTSLKKHKLM